MKKSYIQFIAFSACVLFSTALNAQEVNLPDLLFHPGQMIPTDSHIKVKVGEMAPDFELPSTSGQKVRLSSFRGKKQVVISFVPAAWTPVCSAQWPGYEFALEYFEQANAVILGITVDNIPTLYAWTQAMGGISFPVLSDFYPHGQVAESYGILRSNGVSERAIFVIDLEGIIKFIGLGDIEERPPLEDLIQALQ